MSVAVHDLHVALSKLPMDSGRISQPQARPADAQLGIRELEVLRADVDVITPPEVAQFAEPLVALYQGQVSSGDHLRLPTLTNHDGPAMRAAVARVLGVDTGAAAGTKEGRMLEVLGALESAITNIQRQAAMTRRG